MGESFVMSLLSFFSIVPNRYKEASDVLQRYHGQRTLAMYKRMFKMATKFSRRLNLRSLFKRMMTDKVVGDRALYELVLVGEIASFDIISAKAALYAKAPLDGRTGYPVVFLETILAEMYASKVRPRRDV